MNFIYRKSEGLGWDQSLDQIRRLINESRRKRDKEREMTRKKNATKVLTYGGKMNELVCGRSL